MLKVLDLLQHNPKKRQLVKLIVFDNFTTFNETIAGFIAIACVKMSISF